MNTYTQTVPMPEVHPANGRVYQDLRHLLTATSNLEQLLDNFFFETQTWLNSDGMKYTNPHMDIEYTVGIDGRHQCSYQLFANQDFLGELSFTRSTSFEKDEMELIETLLAVAILPLQQRLRYE